MLVWEDDIYLIKKGEKHLWHSPTLLSLWFWRDLIGALAEVFCKQNKGLIGRRIGKTSQNI